MKVSLQIKGGMQQGAVPVLSYKYNALYKQAELKITGYSYPFLVIYMKIITRLSALSPFFIRISPSHRYRHKSHTIKRTIPWFWRRSGLYRLPDFEIYERWISRVPKIQLLYCIVLNCIVLMGWSLLPNALRPFQDLLCSPEFRYY